MDKLRRALQAQAAEVNSGEAEGMRQQRLMEQVRMMAMQLPPAERAVSLWRLAVLSLNGRLILARFKHMRKAIRSAQRQLDEAQEELNALRLRVVLGSLGWR